MGGVNGNGRHGGNSTAMNGNGWRRRDRDLKAMDGLTAMGSDSTVMDGAVGHQWTVRRDVNGRRDGSLMAMDGAAAPQRQ
jgi:hypothetical protein